MPRGPRLDLPGALHHMMIRGLNQQVIFRDDRDRGDFLARFPVDSVAASLSRGEDRLRLEFIAESEPE